MSSSIGSTEASFGKGPSQVSPPAFEGDNRGGAIKPSAILGTIAGVAGPAAVLAPILAPIAAPIAAIAGIGSAIAKLFGGSLEDGDGFTQGEMDMIMEIKRRFESRRDVKGVIGSSIKS